MHDALYAALRDLPDTGPNGFEGFAVAVLQDFAPELAIVFLAKAGFQRGVDASSAGQGSTWAGLECKHYAPGTCPTARELAGGLTLAINGARDQLDAWLLATSGAIGQLEAAELQQAAERDAVALAIIDWQQAGLPALAVLCAAVSDATIRELTKRLPNLPATAVQADLAAIEAHPAFSARRDELRERLSSAEIGFDHACNAANAWVLQSIGSSTEARARLGQQALCPLDTGFSEWIDRPNLRSALDAWYAEWPSSGAVAVLHGREGAGKSWIGLRWWTELPVKPLTLLVTSNLDAGARDPLDLMTDLLVRQIGMGSPAAWRRRLDRWLRRSPGRTPAILVIIDGINERPREDWGTRFAGFRTQSLVGHVAVLATCWTSYWESRVRPRLAEDLPVHPIPGPPFDDAELREALRRAGRDFDQVPPRLREFLRTPRVFRIAVPYLGELRSGELTIERLLVLDWQHRLRTEYGIAHAEQEFRRIVLGLARDIRAGAPNFEIHRLRAHSSLAQGSPDRNLDRDFGEIVEGDLFEPDPGGDGELRVKQEHTGLVLGMLLADEVRRAAAADPADLDARVEQSVESASGFREASEVLRGTVATACHWTGYPDRALQALLRGWLRLPNRPEEHLEDFEAYLPDRTDAYLGIADEVWAHFDRYVDGREWMASAIVVHLGRDAVFRSVRDHASRWLGYCHEAWHPFLGRAEQAWLDGRRSKVRTSLSRASPAERELVGDYLTVPADDRYPFAADLALLIASQGPRAPFVPGLLAWALSRTLMGLPVDAERVAWCLRLNRVDPTETEQGILEAADRLAAAGNIGRDAAILLLQALGTEACVDRLSALRAPPTIRQSWQRAAPVLPPDAEAPDLTPYLARLSEIGPGDVWTRMGQTTADSDLEDMEPAIAAFAPHDAAAFVRRVLRTAPQRDWLPLRQLSWNAPAHSLLVGPDELGALEDARRRLLPELAENASRDTRLSEGQLMLAMSPVLTPEQLFERLIERPESTQMYSSLEAVFAPLPPETCNEHFVSVVARNEVGPLRAALWFLSAHRFEPTDEARTALVRCFSHDDAVVRIGALRLAACCRDPAALASLREGAWIGPPDDQASSEGFCGSNALCLAAGAGDYAALRARVSPELWGFLAKRDGTEAAIHDFASDLDLLLRMLVAKDIADPSRDPPITVAVDRSDGTEPQQSWIDIASGGDRSRRDIGALSPEAPSAAVERLRQMLDPGAFDERRRETKLTLDGLFKRARQAGATMFGRPFRRHGLTEVIRLRPQLVESWLLRLDGEGSKAVIWRAGEFYRVLALALAPTDPRQAVRIIRRLRGDGRSTRMVFTPLKIDALTWAAFEIPDCPEAAQLPDEILDEAVTDEDLFEIVLVAQEVGAENWLISAIERDAASGILALQARALTLVGWLDDGAALDRLRPLLERRRGYLREVARTAQGRLDRNRLARAWFGEFLSRRDPETAWAAFRVALRCVDRRFHLWSEPMMAAVADLPDRWRLCVAVAADHIRNAIKTNEGKLEDTLFGTKIGSKALAPWHRL